MKKYFFSENLEKVIDKAESTAFDQKHRYIKQIHLLYSLVNSDLPEIQKWFRNHSINIDEFKIKIENKMKLLEKSENPSEAIDEKTKDILELSSIIALNTKSKKIKPFHLFLAILDEPDSDIESIFNEMNIEIGKLEDVYYIEELKKNYLEEQNNLVKYGVNINKIISKKGIVPFTSDWKITDNLVEILSRDIKNLPILVGSLGINKDVLIEGFVEKIKNQKSSEKLENNYVIRIMIDSLIADSKDVNDFINKLRDIILEAENYSNIILYFDEIFPEYYKAGRIDILLLLKPSLSRRNIKIIGFTEKQYLKNYFEEDEFYKNKVELLKLRQISEEKSHEILKNFSRSLENNYGIQISKNNIKYTYQMVKRYLNTNKFIEKAISLLDIVATKVNIKFSNGKRKTKIIRKNDIDEGIAERIDIPKGRVTRDKSFYEKLENQLYENIEGQRHAINSIIETIKMKENYFNLNPNLPDGIFLFVGPRGVGKKKLMGELAEVLYNDRNRISFLDMNKFSESQSVWRLMGFNDSSNDQVYPSLITNLISRYPYSILFLDEIDKAHEKVISIFMDIFKTGKFEDNFGNTVHFKGITIIMTVKAYEEKKKQLGFVSEDIYEYNPEEVKKGLKSLLDEELIHLIDRNIVFNYLNNNEIKKILKTNLKKKLKSKVNTKWIVEESVLNFLLDKVKNNPEKLRAMNRIFQNNIFSYLAINFKINNLFKRDKITIKMKNNEVLIK
ncbi:MAG: ATP-dependent Clp protease ATP-binding subunit [Candidatus Mcinerneyibacterium aminivorans]|uniref:ATP-dependent Clp protease ATP-binding subunit n=1 Tax=Candidatus Mcinerneyibacterium aminivorans TaxID=2703815 RepID=A0A5D0MJL3_9BACT|nr:MAG: ATP-dependent Clp protease ATP-binding subunit [Candidatus Mcinerneyibacterium aminivorans]